MKQIIGYKHGGSNNMPPQSYISDASTSIFDKLSSSKNDDYPQSNKYESIFNKNHNFQLPKQQ